MTDRTAIREEIAEALNMLAGEHEGIGLTGPAARFRRVAEKLTHKKTNREIAEGIARLCRYSTERELAAAIEAALAKKGAGE